MPLAPANSVHASTNPSSLPARGVQATVVRVSFAGCPL
jgi:hypothetical protein